MSDKRFRVLGRVQGERTRAPKPGLRVKAFDRDLVFDDDLGDAVTNERGEFFLEFTEKAFREVFERRPDLYVRVFDATARYVDQGGGKRPGAFAVYLEPWHADVFEVLDLRKNHGKEEMRARDLFYALWIPDLFMRRVEEDGEWSLMCPDECPGLCDTFGKDFEELYTKYEKLGQTRKTVKARDLWYAMVCGAVRCGAVRCDAMRCDAMHRDAKLC